MPSGPLSGLKILDLTENVAGPFCTRLLANFGAEVIKVERPRLGDPARQRAPFFGGSPGPDRSVLFNYLNTSKRSLTLKLDSGFGRNSVLELSKQSDIVVESFTAGYLEDLGIGPSALLDVHPSLVITSIPMFERGNRYADYRLTELNLYAVSGLMSLVGGLDKPPIKAGGYQGQYMSGLHAAALTLFAAYQAVETGEGSWIETSSVESCAKIYSHMVDYTVSGADAIPPAKRRERQSSVLPCKDGYMTVTLYYFQMKALGELLDVPDLATDPRFTSEDNVRENEQALKDMVRRWLLTRTADEAQAEAQSKHLLFTKVNTTKDLIESEHLRARDFFQKVDHPQAGKAEYVGPPFRLSETPMGQITVAPSLGEANHEIFCRRLGVKENELVALQNSGQI